METWTKVVESRTFELIIDEKIISATVKIKFMGYNYDATSQKFKTFSVGLSEVAKVIKALAKNAGFQVISCCSQIYSGGNSIYINVKSELTEEQIAFNTINRSSYDHPCIQEPHGEVLDSIINAFSAGRYDGQFYEVYEYSEAAMKIKDPNGNMLDFTTEYPSASFKTY